MRELFNMLVPRLSKDISRNSRSKLKKIRKDSIEFLMKFYNCCLVTDIRKANSEFGSWKVYIKDQKNRYSNLTDSIEKIEGAVADLVRGMKKMIEPPYRI